MTAHPGHAQSWRSVQEICTTSDQRRLWRGDGTLLSGGVDHGSVATAAAMAALFLLPSCTRGVWPGDTCYRADEGREYRCISGSNATAVWRPVAVAASAAGSAVWGGIIGDMANQADLSAEFSSIAVSLSDKAPLDSPLFTGFPTAPTPAAGDASSRLATTHFVAAAIAAGQSGWEVSVAGPVPSESARNWATNGDANGAIYAVGTAFGTQAWANPAVRTFSTAGKVGVMSEANSTNEITVTDHAWPAGSDITPSGAGAWFAVDFGDYVLRPNGYTIAAGNYHALRSWRLQGTNSIATWSVAGIAGANWTDLDVQTYNTALAASTVSWCHVAMTQPPIGYRYFRLVEAATSSGQHYLCLLEFELYGLLLRPILLPANASGWLTDGAGHFVPYY